MDYFKMTEYGLEIGRIAALIIEGEDNARIRAECESAHKLLGNPAHVIYNDAHAMAADPELGPLN